MKHTHARILKVAVPCLQLAIAAVAASAATHGVDIVNSTFSPPTLNVQPGDSVQWTQQDFGIEHTTTSGTSGTPDGLWSSALLAQSDTFSFTFNNPGTYPYYCIPHSSFMSGSVTVLAATSNSPPTVSISSPTNGASFTTSNTITIIAIANDSDGFVAWVEFFDGTNSLGIDTIDNPFSIDVTLSPGGHLLTAVATDDQGTNTTSQPISVNISSIPINDPIPAHITKGGVTIELQTVAAGLAAPLSMAVPDDGSRRMFINDQNGLGWVLTTQGKLLNPPLIDVRARLVALMSYDERGFLGLATHPNFSQNPLVYTYTSEPNGGAADFPSTLPNGVTNNCQSVLAEWRIDPAHTNQVDPASRREILRVDKPQFNHNGGTIRFGPDGFLYISLGDGGNADDQGDGHVAGGNGQYLHTVLGKFIRINVDGRTSANGQYGVPIDNPFVGADALPEIFAYGFRNPYSFSFDRQTGQLYVGDVGQNKIEEVDILTKGGNFGWNVKEGSFYFDPNGAGAGYVTATPVRDVPPNLIDPIAEYDHDEGLAVVGGFVYRGTQVTALQGRYVFGDWGNFATPSGRLFYLDENSAIQEFHIGLNDRATGFWLKGFGEDADGEVYAFVSRVLGPNGNTGKILKIIAAPSPLSIAGPSATQSNVTINWTGGIGPFALESRGSLSNSAWADTGFTAARTAGTIAQDNAAFLRVVDTANQSAIPFTAALSGAAERPAVTTTANGSGSFALQGNVLTFNVRYSGLSGTGILAHIHGPTNTTQSAPVLIDLAPFNGGAFGIDGTLSGSVVLTPAQQAMVLAGLTYVNVHTPAHSSGEIRGQIAPVLMQASLSGANERPVINSPGFGSGTFSLVGTQLTFNVTYRNLTGAAILAHIHGPATTAESASVLINLAPFNGGAFGTSGSLSGTVGLSPQNLAYVIDGLTYVNVHTPINGGGEIRGQILPLPTAIPFTASMSGAAERPTPINTPATGSGSFSLEGDLLTFNVVYSGLTGTGILAHIHGPASASQAAGVMVNLAPFNGGAFGTNGTLSGTVALTAAQKSALLAGLTYVNVHTPINSGGEIRGQIAPVLMQSYLDGISERPPVYTLGSGSGTFNLVRNQLSFNITYGGLSTPVIDSRIYGPATSSQTNVDIVDLGPFNGGAFGTSGGTAGTVSLNTTNLANLVDGLTYLNYKTVTNASGELRGQIVR